jgi:hypothetical protein
MTPDVIYDQMIGAGCARRLLFSRSGNPGGGVAAPVPGCRAASVAGAAVYAGVSAANRAFKIAQQTLDDPLLDWDCPEDRDRA